MIFKGQIRETKEQITCLVTDLDESMSPPTTPDEISITVPTGRLLCAADGSHVRLVDNRDNELVYWHSLEWQEDPPGVMRAIFQQANKLRFTKQNVLNWMHDHLEDFLDVQTNELHTTAMAEGATTAFEQADPPSPLDDPDHWIWDAAHEVHEIFEQGKIDVCYLCEMAECTGHH